MSMCRVLCCWKRVFAMTSAFSWQNSISLCPASFCTPRPNLPVTPSISSRPTVSGAGTGGCAWPVHFALCHFSCFCTCRSQSWKTLCSLPCPSLPSWPAEVGGRTTATLQESRLVCASVDSVFFFLSYCFLSSHCRLVAKSCPILF